MNTNTRKFYKRQLRDKPFWQILNELIGIVKLLSTPGARDTEILQVFGVTYQELLYRGNTDEEKKLLAIRNKQLKQRKPGNRDVFDPLDQLTGENRIVAEYFSG